MCTSMFTYIHASHTTYIDSGSILKAKPLMLKVVTADLGGGQVLQMIFSFLLFHCLIVQNVYLIYINVKVGKKKHI